MNNQKGSTMIELIMVMTLLALFGLTIYTLIQSGADTQKRIISEKDAQTDARIALSYINVRLRQNDSAGKIGVEVAELTGKNAIVIREPEYAYDTWIFCSDGTLMECLTDSGAQPTELDSFTIAGAEDLESVWDPELGAITNTIYYQYDGSRQSISSTVYLRSY